MFCVKIKNGAQYIIEMQVDPTQGFEKRAQYYAAKHMVGNQIEERRKILRPKGSLYL
ncbi:PD-(D/E)XK nuclease transposase family protein [Orientia tsutsugamushi str. Gilliam]|uniref:PD-(D/E)XK nuclease transposase family protein n=1 Tax=Orientia tsutsugamushi str. Gilliam TaxID=1359184 RepID=A0A0F3M6L2_ORITS|nr:PD-(D/E)XK nuclease transposase family protein [Orientia tsutsugamushi str. Gilliam]